MRFFFTKIKYIIGVNKLNDWYPVELVIDVAACFYFIWAQSGDEISYGLNWLTKYGHYLFICMMWYLILCISVVRQIQKTLLWITRGHNSINYMTEMCADLVLIDRKYYYTGNFETKWKRDTNKKKKNINRHTKQTAINKKSKRWSVFLPFVRFP